jgi:glycosyltransferase involved in cell wall biosynthesis
VRYIALNLDRSKFNPVFVKTGRSRVQKLKELGIKAYAVTNFNGPRLFTPSKDLIEIIQREKIDLIHAHDVRASIKAYVLTKNINIPVISHIHNTYDWMKKKDTRRLLDRLYRNKYTLSIACSQHVKNYYIENNPSHIKEKILVLHNAIDFSQIPQKFNKVMPDDFVKILFVGRLVKQKRVDLLIRAVHEIIRSELCVKLFIVGDGSEKKTLMDLSERLGLLEHVHFLGAKENVFDYYKQADIFVLPSDYEGFASVVLEAFSMKKIVIATNIEPVKEIIKDGETGFLVRRGDYKCLAERMKVVIDNLDEFNETIANNAYLLVKRNFSIEAYIRKLQAIYETDYSII